MAGVPSAPIGAFEIALSEWNTLAGPRNGGLPRELALRLGAHFARDAVLLTEHWEAIVPWAAAETTEASSGQVAEAGDGGWTRRGTGWWTPPGCDRRGNQTRSDGSNGAPTLKPSPPQSPRRW